MFDSQLLRSFVFVADAGSITRAAKCLNLTQSAVSAQIRKLEEQANCVLLERTTRSQSLTVQGALLLDYARNILALNEQAMFRIGSSNHLSGTIKLGCSEGFIAHWIFPIVEVFLMEHPDIEIQITLGITTELHEAVRRGILDIVVGAICEDLEGAEHLWTEPLVWAYAKNKKPDWDKPLPLAFFPEPCPYRKAAVSRLEETGTSWRISCTSPSLAGVQAAALAGLAITPITRSDLIKGLVAVGPNKHLPTLPEAFFAIVTSKKFLGSPIRELVTTIKNTAYN